MIQLLAAVFVVPLGDLNQWSLLNFNKIPPNQVSSEGGGLSVKVQNSASPLVFKLPEIMSVNRITADLQVEGSLSAESGSPKTKDRFQEDFIFRLGLVARGNRTLNWLQRKIAADWVLKLFALAPKGVGLDRIYFFNVAADPSLVGVKREHPKSDLMLEEVVAAHETGGIKVDKSLERPLDIVALWVSIDGDDTKSKFTTIIRSITLEK